MNYKPNEQALTEWAVGEITMIAAHGMVSTFTRDLFESLCDIMRDGTEDAVLDPYEAIKRTLQLRKELTQALKSTGWDDQMIAGWLADFFSPRHIVRFNDIADINATLRLMILDEKARVGFALVPSLEEIRKKQ